MSDSSNPYSNLSWFEPTETEWDDFVLRHRYGDVLQRPAWAHTKAPIWQVRRLALRNADGSILAGAQVLLRPLPFFRHSYMGYAPRGPVLDWEDADLRHFVLREWISMARSWGCISLTFDPAILRSNWEKNLLPECRDLGYQHAGFGYHMEEIQPRFCRILFFRSDENETQRNKRFFSNTRNLIRRAERLPFQFIDCHPEDLTAFFSLMEETGKRDHIGVRNQAYYERLLAAFGTGTGAGADCILAVLDRDQALQDNRKQIRQQEQALKRVQTKRSRNPEAHARLEEEERSCTQALANLQTQAHELATSSEAQIPLACALLLYCGDRCSYLYGGSSDRLRSTAPVYALLPEAFRRAQSRGCHSFDFGGVSGIADPAQDPAHGGLTIFKRQWDTEEIEWIGEFRYSLSPLRDRILQTLVRIRKQLRRPRRR